jgi:hypothetical protein
MVIGLAVVIGSIISATAEAPDLYIEYPTKDLMVESDTITFYGRVAGTGGASIESVKVDGVEAEGDLIRWKAEVSLDVGENPITVVATDEMGESNSTTITVYYQAPTTSPTQTPIDHEAASAIPTPIPPTGSISITSTPPGAEVYLDDFPTPKNTNITLENLTVGAHEIKVTKKGFRSEREYKYVRAGRTEELNFVLEPLTASIFVYSTPPGASVYLDNVYKKDTNCTLSEVAVGPHTITLKKSGYCDVIKNVSVPVGKALDLHENLIECIHGSIDISSDPSGAKVYLDNVFTKENVSVSVGETCPLHVNMTGYGSLYICSDPSEAKVYLDGDFKGETALDISKVVVGTHRIKLTKSHYPDVVKIKHVSAGELKEVDVTFSISPWVSLLIQGGAMGVILAIIAIIFKYVIPVISPKLKETFMTHGDTHEHENVFSYQKDFLFSLDPSYRQHLKEGDVDEKLKKVFEKKKELLTSEVKVSKIDEKQWQIIDGKTQYRIEDTGLGIYKKKNQ